MKAPKVGQHGIVEVYQEHYYPERGECYAPIDENYIDFPCSYTWRAFYEESLYGRNLPPIEPPEIPEQQVQPLPPRYDKLLDRVEQCENKLTYTTDKINTHIQQPSKKHKEDFKGTVPL